MGHAVSATPYTAEGRPFVLETAAVSLRGYIHGEGEGGEAMSGGCPIPPPVQGSTSYRRILMATIGYVAPRGAIKDHIYGSHVEEHLIWQPESIGRMKSEQIKHCIGSSLTVPAEAPVLTGSLCVP